MLVIDGTPIHLANVDVPRGGTAARCWAEAALAQQATQRLGEVAALYSRFDVRRLGTDRDGRELSLVSADGQDLGEELIANGVAVEQSGGRWDWCARPDPSSTAGERLGVVSATESARRGALRIEAAARSALGTGGR